MRGENIGHLFTMFPTAFGQHKIIVHTVVQSNGTFSDLKDVLLNSDTDIDADFSTPIYVLLLQIFSAYFAYIFGKQMEIIFYIIYKI